MHAIRSAAHSADYDGDGDSAEPLGDEQATLSTAQLTQIRAVSSRCHR